MSADASSPANHRLKAYKNKALDSQELRRRREEEGIQLRKQKRDEQVNMIEEKIGSIGQDARKHVFGVSNKGRLKPVSSATATI